MPDTKTNLPTPYESALRVLKESGEFTPTQEEVLAKAMAASVAAFSAIIGDRARQKQEELARQRSQ